MTLKATMDVETYFIFKTTATTTTNITTTATTIMITIIFFYTCKDRYDIKYMRRHEHMYSTLTSYMYRYSYTLVCTVFCTVFYGSTTWHNIEHKTGLYESVHLQRRESVLVLSTYLSSRASKTGPQSCGINGSRSSWPNRTFRAAFWLSWALPNCDWPVSTYASAWFTLLSMLSTITPAHTPP